jgi:hypothetical protein
MRIMSIAYEDAIVQDRPGSAPRDLLGGMTIERWAPSQTYTRQEPAILKSLAGYGRSILRERPPPQLKEVVGACITGSIPDTASHPGG